MSGWLQLSSYRPWSWSCRKLKAGVDEERPHWFVLMQPPVVQHCVDSLRKCPSQSTSACFKSQIISCYFSPTLVFIIASNNRIYFYLHLHNMDEHTIKLITVSNVKLVSVVQLFGHEQKKVKISNIFFIPVSRLINVRVSSAASHIFKKKKKGHLKEKALFLKICLFRWFPCRNQADTRWKCGIVCLLYHSLSPLTLCCPSIKDEAAAVGAQGYISAL